MRYSVTALTPLLVGDGRMLSPIDYMVWKDQVNVLDQARIFKLLARGPRLDGYLAQLRKATKLDFASWGGFAQNFSQRRIPFEHPSSTAVWNAASSEALFIPTFAAGTSGAYLPGSALKGALRTALIFSRWNAGTMERIASAIEDDRWPRRSSDAAESAAGASQVRVVGIADSDTVPPATFKVYLTRTASLDTREAGKAKLVWKVAGRGSVPPQRIAEATPVFAEMAVPGVSFSGTWHESSFLENPDLTRALGWRSVPSASLFTEAVNAYASAQLEAHANFAEMTGLPELQTAVRRLQSEVEAARNASLSCVISLGWGGGFLTKAAFLDTAQPAYRSILRSVPGIGRSIRENIPYPKTRRIVFSGGQSSSLPGWVRVRFETGA